MTKQVLLSITGLQFSEEDAPEPVEIYTMAEYYFRNGTHYLLYEEPVEDSSQMMKATLKIRKKCVEIMKKGPLQVHLIFEQGKNHVCQYDTPFGSIPVDIRTKEVWMEEDEQNIHAELKYTLVMGGEFLADSQVTLRVKSKDAMDFTLDT